ncbi:hypothetical protein [Falsiroseomonas sp.]|uniref:bestrophin-like domain n=1 Tax=Falsiroseomonas sp. TaxID=2870721 RepID=UPI0034A0EA55
MDISLFTSLASLPTPVAALLAIGVPVLIAIGLGSAMFAVFTHQEFTHNAFMASVKFSFVVEIYAAVAALTLVGAWNIYEGTRETLQKEAGALYMLALSVDAYGSPSQDGLRSDMRAAIRTYAGDVVSVDWPSLQAGVPSTASDPSFQRLARVFLDAEPTTAAQQALAQNIAQWVAQAAEARIGRLSVASRTLSTLLWFLVVIVSVAVLVFQWFFGGPNHGLHYAMGAVTAVIVGCVLLVAVKLAHPFVGVPPLLSARPFLELMQVQ